MGRPPGTTTPTGSNICLMLLCLPYPIQFETRECCASQQTRCYPPIFIQLAMLLCCPQYLCGTPPDPTVAEVRETSCLCATCCEPPEPEGGARRGPSGSAAGNAKETACGAEGCSNTAAGACANHLCRNCCEVNGELSCKRHNISGRKDAPTAAAAESIPPTAEVIPVSV